MSTEVVKEAKLEEEPRQCTKKEKLGHAIGVLGHASMYTLWSTWTTPFLTDILKLPAGFLAFLFGGARFFDAFTDISMGIIADSTRSKWGRFRPWLLRSGPLMGICLALSFFKPDIGTIGLCIFAGIMYIITGSIVFTSVDIPFWSLPAAMTSNTKERSEIVGFTTTASNTITGIIGLVMPMALAFFGEFNWYVYFFLALAVAVWGVTMYLISFKLVREHVVPDDSEKFELKLALKNIFQNKPLLLIQISNIFCLLGMMLKGYLNYYYCVYNWGSLGYMTVLNLINLVGMVVGALIFTFLSQHIGKKNCMFLFAGLMTISSLVLYFAGYHNAIVLFATSSVSTVCVGAVMVCVNAMMMDTIEYGEWKTGQRNEAMITSTRCFVTKCVMAVAGIAVAAVIGLTGYIPQETVQPVNVLNSFHFVYTLVSAGIIILAVVPMLFYKLTEKRHAEIMEELAARKASKTQ